MWCGRRFRNGRKGSQCHSQYQILYEGGDAWISNHVQPEQYEDANVLSAQMQDYFEEKGGTCKIIDENP